MKDATFASGQGSAPVAIVLALALAATVGVSAQSWEPRAPPRASTPAAADDQGASLLRALADWAIGRGRAADCGSPQAR